MCTTLEVSRSGFYDWLKREPSERSKSDARLTELIREIHTSSRGIYGAPRIHAAFKAGVNVKLYLRDVLQRIAAETDVKKLLPHSWKEHFEAEVEGRRNAIIDLLVADQRRE